jgi:formate hydrogenlyase subunit 4
VIGLCVFIVKMAALAFALAVFESTIAKMRVFRVRPDKLVVSGQ